MLHRSKKCSFSLFAGVCTAAVAVLGIGGYILHKKIVKFRLQDLARRQAMNLAMFDLNKGGGLYDDDDYDYEEDDDYDYEDAYENLFNDLKQGEDDNA